MPPYPFAEIEKNQKGESFLAYSNGAGRNDPIVIYNKAGKQENVGGNNLKTNICMRFKWESDKQNTLANLLIHIIIIHFN